MSTIKEATLRVTFDDGSYHEFEWSSEVHPVEFEMTKHAGFPMMQTGSVEATFSRWPRMETYRPPTEDT